MLQSLYFLYVDQTWHKHNTKYSNHIKPKYLNQSHNSDLLWKYNKLHLYIKKNHLHSVVELLISVNEWLNYVKHHVIFMSYPWNNNEVNIIKEYPIHKLVQPEVLEHMSKQCNAYLTTVLNTTGTVTSKL